MIYSTNLFTGLLTPTNRVLFTVPAATVCVVRDIEATPVTGPANQISINAVVAGQGVTIWLPPPANAYEWLQWDGRVVLPSSSTIDGNSTFAGTQVIISGYLLT